MEHAVFTSAQSQKGDGYHLVARSAGITDADARELTAWGPSHDALAQQKVVAKSINFFRLSSGQFCIGRTITAGEEYSERGGWKVLTNYVVVSPADLFRFANNPFAIVRAALAAGEFDLPDPISSRLPAIEIAGRAAKIDHAALYRISSKLSHEEVIDLVKRIFADQRTVIATEINAELLVLAIVNTLPIDRRTELTFSTGLRLSQQRPFRLVVLPPDADEEFKRARHSGMEVLPVFAQKSRECLSSATAFAE